MEFERNKAGIPIRKCCASCESRDDKIRTRGEKRTCLLGQTDPNRLLNCDRWRMRKKIMEMKVGGGRVKSDKYFNYLMSIRHKEIRSQEEHDKDNTNPLPRKQTIPEIRKKFIKLYGSLYE